jgi:hypothetical protein
VIPQPYKQGLIPVQSQLWLHCLAQDHLKKWFPLRSKLANADGKSLAIIDEDLERVLMVMNMSWAQSMRKCYGAGLVVFHVFCNERFIPKDQHCLVDTCTMLNFVLSCAGPYSSKMLANYVYVIKAWHMLHGQQWRVQQDELKTALDGASGFTLESSKQIKHKPFF